MKRPPGERRPLAPKQEGVANMADDQLEELRKARSALILARQQQAKTIQSTANGANAREFIGAL
jgi:hypothetical protein